jgi:hypothetical protein
MCRMMPNLSYRGPWFRYSGTANRYLATIAAVLFVVLLGTLFFKPSFRPPAPSVEDDLATIALPESDLDPAPFSEKDLFSATALPDSEGSPAGTEADLRLVGIIPGDVPQAVIEDRASQQTHYLYETQSFDGFTVERIESDAVIVIQGGIKKRIRL